MNARLRRVPLLVAAIALPLGCLAPNARDDGHAAPRDGLDGYRLTAGEARSAAGCRYDYRVYEPTGTAGAGGTTPGRTTEGSPGATVGRPVTTVMLGHGFLRNQDTLVGLARALANAGLRAVTLDFCNMRPWNGHHERNARDLRALAERLAVDDVVYAGFSAGALAAVLAGAEDPTTRGVLTLDLVDQGGLAVAALATLDAPLIGLQGPPSACNARGSGQRVFDTRPGAVLETLPGASHCEFESPTDRLCETVCGDDDPDADDERVRAEVIRRAVRAVAGLVGNSSRSGAGSPVVAAGL